MFGVRANAPGNPLSVERAAEMGVTFETIREMLRKQRCIWVAEHEGRIVGFPMADVEEACLFAAFARPGWEGLGSGRQRVERAEAVPFERHPSIWLVTDGSSPPAGFDEWLCAGAVRSWKAATYGLRSIGPAAPAGTERRLRRPGIASPNNRKGSTADGPPPSVRSPHHLRPDEVVCGRSGFRPTSEKAAARSRVSVIPRVAKLGTVEADDDAYPSGGR